MISLIDQIEMRIDYARDLYHNLISCEEDLDFMLPPDIEISAARPLEGFFRTSVIPPPPAISIDPTLLALAVGKNIKQRREQLAMTQQELSEKTGIRRPNIARLERGCSLPTLSTLLRIASGLEISFKSFF